jgi:hypothetical protein
MNKRQFLNFVELVKGKGLQIDPALIDTLKAKLEKKFGDLDVLDLSKLDDKITDFAVHIGLIKLYKLGERKFAKLTAWFKKMIANFDKEELEAIWNNLLKKLGGE